MKAKNSANTIRMVSGTCKFFPVPSPLGGEGKGEGE